MSDTPERSDIVDSETALRVAGESLATHAHDPDLAALADARLDSPVIVHTTAGEPSYWLVPLRSDDRVVGFARVTADGTVAAIGRYGGSSPLDLDADSVLSLAADHLTERTVVAGPILVHDGPTGREAWMLLVSSEDGPPHRLFVTPAGVYERTADDRAP